MHLAFLPIKKAKLFDVKHLLQHVFLRDHVTFYKALRNAKFVQHSNEKEAE